MADGSFFHRARWTLTRLLLALLVALALAVFVRQFTDHEERSLEVAAPLVGVHHWHAVYDVYVCGQRQPNFPTWEAGVHTHADGVIHIHPFVPSEEGEGARLVKWFEYGGGKLTQTEMRMPASRVTLHNGDRCPDGREAVLQVFVNGQRLDDWSGYIPRDGDQVHIVFGPEEAGN